MVLVRVIVTKPQGIVEVATRLAAVTIAAIVHTQIVAGIGHLERIFGLCGDFEPLLVFLNGAREVGLVTQQNAMMLEGNHLAHLVALVMRLAGHPCQGVHIVDGPHNAVKTDITCLVALGCPHPITARSHHKQHGEHDKCPHVPGNSKTSTTFFH